MDEEVMREADNEKVDADIEVTGTRNGFLGSISLRPETVVVLEELRAGVKRLPKLYKPPEARHKWGEPQHHPHGNWGDIFFDLIYVAIAYLLGDLLIISNDNSVYSVDTESLGTFFALFLLFYTCWYNRMIRHGWLKTGDFFHEVLSYTTGLLVALAAHNIYKVELLKDFSNGAALKISIFLLVVYTLDVVKWAEFYFFHTGNKREHGKRQLYYTGCSMVCLILAVVGIHAGWRLEVINLLWGLAYAIQRILMFVYAKLNYFTEEKTIPIWIEYVIQRKGEWTLLMLGEGVLQIVFSKNPITAEFAFHTILSYLIMTMLQLLHYTTLPFHPSDHCLRHSPRKAILWFNVETFYSISLILVGVALKLSFKKKQEGFSAFLGCSLLTALTLLFCLEWLHQKSNDSIRTTSRTWKQRSIKAFLTLLFLVPISFQGLEHEVWLTLIFVFLAIVALVLVQASNRAFIRRKRFKRTLAAVIAAGKFKNLLNKKRERALSNATNTTNTTNATNETNETNAKSRSLSVSEKKKRKKFGIWEKMKWSNIYTPVKVGTWDNLAEAHDTDWVELFFDLIFVALLVEIGELLVHSMAKAGILHISVWYFFSLFLAVYGVWSFRVMIVSMFTEASLFHKVLDLAEGSMVCLMAAACNEFIGLEDDSGYTTKCVCSSGDDDGYGYTGGNSSYGENMSKSLEDDFGHRILAGAGGAEAYPEDIESCHLEHSMLSDDYSRLLAEYSSEPKDNVNEKSFTFLFSTCMIVFYLIQICRALELLFTQNKDSVAGRYSWILLQRISVGIFPLLLSYIPESFLDSESETDPKLAWVTFLWAMSFVMGNVYIFCRIMMGKVHQRNALPVSLPFQIHRRAEWVILCIGAGIFRIITNIPIKRDICAIKIFTSMGSATTFVMIYFALAAMKRLFFETERFDPRYHAMRLSNIRGFVWTLICPLVSLSIVAVGSTMAAILAAEFEWYEGDQYNRYYWTLSICGSATLLLFWVCDLLHVGKCELQIYHKGNTQQRLKQAAIFFLKLGLAFSLYMQPFLTELEPWAKIVLFSITFLLAEPLQRWHSWIRFELLCGLDAAEATGADIEVKVIENSPNPDPKVEEKGNDMIQIS